jgi:hypothetical protein
MWNKTVVILLFFLFGIGTYVEAISWIDVDPEEVVTRSDVVVRGTYDMSSEKISGGDHLYSGVKFKVAKVYKGEGIGSEIIAGLNGHDFTWVEEFQKEQGEFILFLEIGDSTFLTPVVGPNGMIPYKNGAIVHLVENKQQFYENYLKKIEQEKVVKKEPVKLTKEVKPVKERSTWSLFKTKYLPIVILGVIVLVAGRWMVKRRKVVV